MSNTRFLKLIYERQRRTSILFSEIFTRLYNNEFDEEYSNIKIQLPPPVYLTMTNNQQLLDNVSQMADKLIEFELTNDEDEVKENELRDENTYGEAEREGNLGREDNDEEDEDFEGDDYE